MPPQNVGDSWLTGRRFGIVIDAGSSGSRLQIYSWRDPRVVLLDLEADKDAAAEEIRRSLPKVQKGTKEGADWVSRVQPGISSYADDPESVAAHLAPLLNHARDTVPPSLHSSTPIFLLATAGMRLLRQDQQDALLLHACTFIRHHSNFHVDEPSGAGPCGRSVRVITGEEEGLFGWIAVNYLMDGFGGTGDGTGNRTTYGFLDMGGASTQIAFEPAPEHQSADQNLIDVKLRLLGGDEILHKVFVTTWLGYGTNQARERYVGRAITEYEQRHTVMTDETDMHVVPDPCLPKGLQLKELPIAPSTHSPSHHTSHISSSALPAHRILGTGSFTECLKHTLPLLNKHLPCPASPCLMNAIHVPPIDFSVSHFIGVSEYWYSSEHVFGLGGPYDFVQYERAAEEFCARDWEDIVKEHEEGVEKRKRKGVIAGVDEVVLHETEEKNKWGPEVELSRLEMQCFKAAWIANVLHEGLGMPRIVDPGGNVTADNGASQVAEQADRKGLLTVDSNQKKKRPTFQSIDTVGDFAISWTLGKIVLEASKEVPLKHKTDMPIGDPLADMSRLNMSKPDPVLLPPVSERPAFRIVGSFRLAPLVVVMYAILICVLAFMIYRLRRQVRTPCFRLVSRGLHVVTCRERRRSISPSSRSLEEGYKRPLTQRARRKSQKTWIYPFRRVIPSSILPPQPHPWPNGVAKYRSPPPLILKKRTESAIGNGNATNQRKLSSPHPYTSKSSPPSPTISSAMSSPVLSSFITPTGRDLSLGDTIIDLSQVPPDQPVPSRSYSVPDGLSNTIRSGEIVVASSSTSTQYTQIHRHTGMSMPSFRSVSRCVSPEPIIGVLPDDDGGMEMSASTSTPSGGLLNGVSRNVSTGSLSTVVPRQASSSAFSASKGSANGVPV